MRIALIGYGKMGQAIAAIAQAQGHSIGLTITSANQQDLTPTNLQGCNVAIEFTNPHSAVQNIKACFAARVPVVCGSTGWLQHWDGVAADCQQKNGGLLYASNFSLGVNIFFAVNKALANLMSQQAGYEVSITEIHHTQKKDAPSGTAITLAEQVMAAIPAKKQWVNHTAAAPDELAITSLRQDSAPGTHTVQYSSAIDDISITHTAHNRQGFAAGAVQAAVFMAGKKGIYTMQDVLGL